MIAIYQLARAYNGAAEGLTSSGTALTLLIRAGLGM
jgi:hypothetical protein